MKKGLYLLFANNLQDKWSGVNRKILAQIKVFNDVGVAFEPYNIPVRAETKLTKILKRLPFSNTTPIWKADTKLAATDYIYFRFPPYMNYHMYRCFGKIKKQNPQLIILMEIPTFPYDKEMTGQVGHRLINYPLLWKDRFWRKYIHNVVDYIVTPSENKDTIWGIPVLQISNGIITSDYFPRHPDENDTIDLLAVAEFREWHGYERIIEGLHNYTGNRKIIIHMVGEGPELQRYQKLVSIYGLQDRVCFYGKKTLSELNYLYDIADIGLCSFGGYKKGLFFSRELKSREYLIKGLPIVSGCELDVLKKGDYGYLLFPNDDSEIDINQIVTFYDDIYDKSDIAFVVNKMRKIALEKVSMEKCMKSVLNIMNNQ